jgi:carbamoyltransferase
MVNGIPCGRKNHSVGTPQWYLGLNHGKHDSASALLQDGRLIVAVEQERISRKKRATEQAPVDALRYCLDWVGIKLQDVRGISLGSDHDALARWLRLDNAQRTDKLYYDTPQRLFPESAFGRGAVPEIHAMPHHLAHAASAFWPSGFAETAILVMDAMGEDSAGIIAHGHGKRIDVLKQLPIEHSLGYYYEAASLYAGLGKNDVGKLMGLAGYGNPGLDMPLHVVNGKPVWTGISHGNALGQELLDARRDALLDEFKRTAFPFEQGLKDEIMAYADFAASVQASLERAIYSLALDARELTGSKNLVLAGGVALNCTANGLLANSGMFERLYIQPAAHDAGVAIGAGMLLANEYIPAAPQEVKTAYIGPAEDNAEVIELLQAEGRRYEIYSPEGLARKAAALVADGAVVAWHQGRAEFGPRALGARSLVADPRTRRSLVRLNKIKGREMWRPIAPSVTAEHFDDYFIGLPNPHMLVAASVRQAKRSTVPAITHVDGSARPQAVRMTDNKLWWSLITEFHQLTGVPVIANTSLNLKDESIANKAADTLRILDRSDIDVAVIGPAVMTKGT